MARYAAWRPKSTGQNARQAAFAFDGDVYGGFDARSFTPAQLDWAQDHVCILSGLYGVLRPLDRLQPYRLEMGTALANRHGKDLYAFWGARIAEHLNERLAADRTPVVINAASQEYFRAADTRALKARVVECVFEEWKGERYKVISFFAKRARPAGALGRAAPRGHAQGAGKIRSRGLWFRRPGVHGRTAGLQEKTRMNDVREAGEATGARA